MAGVEVGALEVGAPNANAGALGAPVGDASTWRQTGQADENAIQ